jgi:site-specific DNA recombinase
MVIAIQTGRSVIMHALKRIVLYTRYATDQQDLAWITTQPDLGKQFVLRQGWHLADTFVDAYVSGSSFETRHGLQAALAVAKTGGRVSLPYSRSPFPRP